MFVGTQWAYPHAHLYQVQSVTVRVAVVVVAKYIVLETRDMNPHPHLDLHKMRVGGVRVWVGNDVYLPKMHWP